MRNFFLFFSFFALNFIGITPYEFSIVFISSFFILFFIFFFEDIHTIIIHECNSRVKSEIVLRTLQNNPHNLSLRDSLISKEEKRRPPGAQSHPSYKRINGRLARVVSNTGIRQFSTEITNYVSTHAVEDRKRARLCLPEQNDRFVGRSSTTVRRRSRSLILVSDLRDHSDRRVDEIIGLSRRAAETRLPSHPITPLGNKQETIDGRERGWNRASAKRRAGVHKFFCNRRHFVC